jgi:hypothetical protein
MPLPIFDSDHLQRLAEDGEDLFFQETNCILDRMSIAITSGTDEYTLPDYVYNVKRVTWKGRKIEPVNHRDYREKLFVQNSQGRVDYYIYDNVGIQRIKFFRSPGETLSLVTGDLFNAAQIIQGLIIEFWRVPDHINYIIPEVFRRRLLKAYAMKAAYASEGKGQSNRNSQYFDGKWKAFHDGYTQLLTSLANRPRQLIIKNREGRISRLPQPRLDDRFGIGVDF